MLSLLYFFAFKNYQISGSSINVFDLLEISILDTQILTVSGQRRVRWFLLICSMILLFIYVYLIYRFFIFKNLGNSLSELGLLFHGAGLMNFIYAAKMIQELMQIKTSKNEKIGIKQTSYLGPNIKWTKILVKSVSFFLLISIDIYFLDYFLNGNFIISNTLFLILGIMGISLGHILLIYFILIQ